MVPFVATLEVLDYLTQLEDELERRNVPKGERSLARREVKYLVEDLAFRNALLQGRVMPEDEDYNQALEALREPRQAAAALEPARPRLKAVRKRKRLTSALVLAILVVAVAGLAILAGTQERDVVLDNFSVTHGRDPNVRDQEPLTRSTMETFTLSESGNYETVRVIAEPVVATEGRIILTLLNPRDEVVWVKEWVPGDVRYAKRDVPAEPGQWRLLIDFDRAYGTATVTVHAVRPT